MLSRINRFHRRNQVIATQKGGKSVRGKKISLKYREGYAKQPVRVAVIVSKKVSKSAVRRNRIRRRIYDAVRHNFEMIPANLQCVITAYDESLKDCPYNEIDDEIVKLFATLK